MNRWVQLGLVAAASVLAAAASDCGRTSTGLQPLDEPYWIGTYQGMRGGLYPNGANARPAAHEAAGLRFAAEVTPRDAGGVPDPAGRIVFLSIGMSNTTQEFSLFQQNANRDSAKNPAVTIVDGAQGGWSADRIVAGGAAYWTTVDERLRAAGVTAAQVQAAWMKEADAGPTLSFPADAQRLQGELKTLARTLRSRFPNLRLLYLSSRIYAGYASTALNPEPYAYQSGFAVKWLIEQQIQGDPELSYETGQAPWLAWGPYLWADGTRRRSDGLVWECADLSSDGTHPSSSGRAKVAAMLLDFLKSDSTARPWFLGAPAVPPPTPAPKALVNAAGYFASTAPGSIASLFGLELSGVTGWGQTVPLPHDIGGTQVLIGGEPAPLFYVSPLQINLRIPVAPRGAEVVVLRHRTASAAINAPLRLDTPGLFSADATGSGPAAASHAGGVPVSAQMPARRGETIEVYGTGQGIRNPAMMMPEFEPVAQIGGARAAVTYLGPAPGWVGLDQINITVPPDAPTGAAVPLTLRLGTFTSNPVTLAIAP